jgi:hypothetical protein
MWADLIIGSGMLNWRASTTSTNAVALGPYVWALDSDGYLYLAYKNPPYISSIYYVCVVSSSSTAGLWPRLDSQNYVDSVVAAYPGTFDKVKGCIDSVTGALTLSALGRTNILWCGVELWFSFGNGSEIGRGVCTKMHPKAIAQH